MIDDEPLIRWSLAEALTASGHEVAEAGDARSALGTLSAAWPGRPFDVVLLDLRLPDAHDLSVLARLRALVPDVPVILMTADATPDIARGAMELGVYRIVSKPFDPFRLAALAVEAYDASSW